MWLQALYMIYNLCTFMLFCMSFSVLANTHKLYNQFSFVAIKPKLILGPYRWYNLNDSLRQDPDGEIENFRKSIFEIRIQKFCYIQVIVFDLSYLPVAAVGIKRVFHIFSLQIAKVKNYNLNVTEVLNSDFKNVFPGIFNFTIGILLQQSATKQWTLQSYVG